MIVNRRVPPALASRMAAVAEKLDAAGAVHAPFQRYLDAPHEIYGREVCLSDPPAVYYQLGIDNLHWRENLTDEVQLIFLDVPRDVEKFAAAIGYRTKIIERLPVFEKGGVPHPTRGPLHSVIMVPL